MIYVGKNRIHYAKIDSTNEALKRVWKETTLEEGTLLTADFQEGGKGQLGARWESNAKANFLGTFLLKPQINIIEGFVLNMIASLAVKETVKEFVNKVVEVKWPNDIVVDGKKIAGILIENKLKGKDVLASFIGVGLNINQEIFTIFPRQGTSIRKEIGREVERELVISKLNFHLQQFYALYKVKGFSTISYLYHQDLYLKGGRFTYLTNDIRKKLILQSVNKNGDLQLFNEMGVIEEYGLKEIVFMT